MMNSLIVIVKPPAFSTSIPATLRDNAVLRKHILMHCKNTRGLCSKHHTKIQEMDTGQLRHQNMRSPGLRATAAIPFGSSLASERVNPSTAHFEVQYADTCHPHIPSKKPRCTTHESLLLFHNLTQFSELLLKQIS